MDNISPESILHLVKLVLDVWQDKYEVAEPYLQVLTILMP